MKIGTSTLTLDVTGKKMKLYCHVLNLNKLEERKSLVKDAYSLWDEMNSIGEDFCVIRRWALFFERVA